MQFTVDQAAVWAALIALLGIIGTAIKIVASRHLVTLDKVSATQEILVTQSGEHIELTRKIVDGLSTRMTLSKIQSIVARSHPGDFTCDVCHGWEGPDNARPANQPRCSCTSPEGSKA